KKKNKNINVSIKNYTDDCRMAKILDRWQDSGRSVSSLVCEAIYQSDSIENSETLLNVMSLHNFLIKAMEFKGIEPTMFNIEAVLNKIISIEKGSIESMLDEMVWNNQENGVSKNKVEKVDVGVIENVTEPNRHVIEEIPVVEETSVIEETPIVEDTTVQREYTSYAPPKNYDIFGDVKHEKKEIDAINPLLGGD
ncbi:MAG: hypothetical protein R3Y64_09375, partial [Peptostreptococcaceae bacterium]